jgi:hypothetical protein
VRRALLVALVLLCGLGTVATWGKERKVRCSPKLCREAVTACVASGEKRRKCKKGVVQVCKAVGPALCLPPTTTTTIPPAATTLDVSGVWTLAASQTQNPCAIDAPPTLGGEVGIQQFGSVLAGDFGENTLAGQFTAANAFVFAIGQFCAAPGCCGGAALSASGLAGTPGALGGSAVFEFTARCLGFTCNVRYEGIIGQGSDGGGGGGGGGGPKR